MKRAIAAAVMAAVVGGMMVPVFGAAAEGTVLNPTAVPATTAPQGKAKVAVIELQDRLVERPPAFQFSLGALMGNEKPVALSSLIVQLDKAVKDPSLGGVFLDLSAFSLTLNQAQEVGALLTNLRHAGKRVAVYSADYDTATYVLASYADTVIMPENGDVLIPGVGLEMVFFKGTLTKLNLQADFVQIGKYKGAEEPFTRESASPEYRQQIEKLVDGMYGEVVGIIGKNRPNMDEAGVKKAIDEGLISGKHAKEMGLVDKTMGRGQVEGWWNSQFPGGAELIEDYGQPKKKAVDLNSPFALFSLFGEKPKVKVKEPAVAVIYATGEIVPDFVGGEDSTDEVTPAGIRAAVKEALDDDNVKAIVVRVDSPGGSASASDEIWQVLHDADKKKPVTISMGRLAASGGYYISCAGRHITADPATITGSIGVVAGKVVVKGLTDKIGLNIEPVVKGAHAMMFSMLTPFTEEEKAFLKKEMEETYGVFTSRVMGARGGKIAKLEDVAQGRLFTGEQGKAAGLVDDVGTLNEVIGTAAKGAKIEKRYEILVLPRPKTFADVLREGLMKDASAPALGSIGHVDVDPMGAVVEALPAELRGAVRGGVALVRSMEKEHVMMAMPGVVEVDGK